MADSANTTTLPAVDPWISLAEAAGVSFVHTASGKHAARDKDGVYVVRGCLSIAEAARSFCEDRDLVASTPDAILARIKAQYRPYDALPAFAEGFEAYQRKAPLGFNPYEKPPARLPGRDGETTGEALLRQVNGQAWDRGANAAMLYERALAHLDAHPTSDEPAAGSDWLMQLLMNGGGR
jgi:hypothetical protein